MNSWLPMNPPVATPFFFYCSPRSMIIGGILVITRKNAVHSALALITTLLAQAGLYLMLYAPFVAGVQIILYAGGIMVLFLFVIMLINIERADERAAVQQAVAGRNRRRGGTRRTVHRGLHDHDKGQDVVSSKAGMRYGEGQNTQAIASLLFDRHSGQYMFAFEIASLLLLVAIIGAVVMAKKRI